MVAGALPRRIVFFTLQLYPKPRRNTNGRMGTGAYFPQIFSRSSGFRYMPSPSRTPKAS